MLPSAQRLAAALILCLSAALPAAAQEPAGTAEEKPLVYNFAFCKSVIEEELNARAALVKGDAFLDPDREAELRTHMLFMSSPPKLSSSLDFIGTPAEIQRCRTIAEAFQRYNETFLWRGMLGSTLSTIVRNRAVVRVKRLEDSFEWFEEMGPPYKENMNGYDAAYRKFVDIAKKLKANQDISVKAKNRRFVWNVDFLDVFNYVGLNEYALKDLRASPYFENEMRVLDNHIVAVSDSKLDEQKSMLDALMKEWNRAYSIFAKVKESVQKLPGYADIQPIVDADEKILINSFSLLDTGLTAIDYMNNDATIGGSLRAWKNVAATAFDTGDSISSGGGPVYTRRLRKSLTELRRIWNDSVVHLDVAYGGSQGWHTMKY